MRRNMVELVRLNEILEMPREQQLNVHLDEIQEIVDVLKPEDFAVYGKPLCQLLIDIANGKRIIFECDTDTSIPEETHEQKSPPPKPRKSKTKTKDDGPVYVEYPKWIPNR